MTTRTLMPSDVSELDRRHHVTDLNESLMLPPTRAHGFLGQIDPASCAPVPGVPYECQRSTFTTTLTAGSRSG